MIKVENLVTPSPKQWEVAIHGMRNALASWERSDSEIKLTNEVTREDCLKCTNYYSGKCYGKSGMLCGLIIGEKDKQLLLNLCKAGDPSHRKLLRQLPVIMDITAPEYFWRQLDTYKVGTIANSTSQMHTLVKEPFKLEDFSLDDLADPNYYIESGHVGIELNNYVESIIPTLNTLRDRYLETKERKYWDAILKLIPQSFNYTRTWSGNYEVLVNMINQRKGHKLEEWKTFSELMLENIPYLKEIVGAINESN